MNELLKEMLAKDTETPQSDRELQEKMLARRLGKSADTPPTVVVRAAEPDTVVDVAVSSSEEANPADATRGANRPRRGARWRAIQGCGTVIAVLAACAAGGAFIGGIRQKEIDPRANPGPYARPTILVFGPAEDKLAKLDQFNSVLKDYTVGRPEGAPGRVDEEFLYVRPMWHVYDRVRANDVEQLYGFVSASADSKITTYIGQRLRDEASALSHTMAMEPDPYRKIDIFVGHISRGLPTDLDTQHKIEMIKHTLWQCETNRQNTPIWGSLPTDYFILPHGSTVIKLGQVATGEVFAKSDTQVIDNSKLGFRRRVSTTRLNIQREKNKRG
jgi:hypothetical protein